jgi:hypothetical protein
VLRAGRTVVVCAGDVVAMQDEAEVPVATMLATIMAIAGRAGIEG